MSNLSKSFLAFVLAAACAAPSSDHEHDRGSSPRAPDATSVTIGRNSEALDATASCDESGSSAAATDPDSGTAPETREPNATIEAGGTWTASVASATETVGDGSPHRIASDAHGADAHATEAQAADARELDARDSEASSVTEAPESTPWLRIDRGPGQLALLVPRSEDLGFRVVIDVGILGEVEAGKVVLSTGVERYVSGLPPARGSQAKQPAGAALEGRPEIGWLKSRATGGYGGYTLEHELQSRVLPQVWPRVLYTDTQSGSENRRRELRIGDLEGRPTVWYRNDGHCKGCQNPAHFVESRWMWGDAEHCKKCKRAEHRLWRASATRDVPSATVDMLSAVYLARTMVREGVSETAFPLVDKQKLWDVKLQLGRRKRITTPAGTFDAREVKLSTSRPPGEPIDKDDEGFEGMFGIRGTIQIWLEAQSGVPVLIEGELPVPVLGEFDVRVELVRYEGTPEQFGPIE